MSVETRSPGQWRRLEIGYVDLHAWVDRRNKRGITRRNLLAIQKTTGYRGAWVTNDAKSMSAAFVEPVFFDSIVPQSCKRLCQCPTCDGEHMRKNSKKERSNSGYKSSYISGMERAIYSIKFLTSTERVENVESGMRAEDGWVSE